MSEWAQLTRIEKVQEIRRQQMLHPEWRHQDVADALDIKLTTLHNLLNDPTGDKQRRRRERYQGTCEKCGSVTKSDGTSRPSPMCQSCANQERKKWTPEAIIAAVQRFVAETGSKPSSQKWLYAETRPDWAPCTQTVLLEFGSWNNMIRAAGLPVLEKGGHYKRTPESRAKLSRSQRSAQRRRHGFARDYGDLERVVVSLSQDQVLRLGELNGVGISEHLRRAADLYLSTMHGLVRRAA